MGWGAHAQINSSDTLIFDLSRASCAGSFFVVPVSFKSDDVIYAIDFSTKYNLAKITYNSIINYYPASVVASANYNISDSTLRFTSFCMSSMAHDTAIISVKFNLISGPVTVSDFNNIHAYLNGDLCSYKIIPPVVASIAASGPAVISFGDTLSLIGTPGSGLTYLWSTSATTSSISITTPGTYTVTVTNSGGCSSSAAISITASPLPVVLLDFSAAENGSTILLEWVTASEINNDYFTVEKISDDSKWVEVEKVHGAGNSNTTLSYSAMDMYPFLGINYYRLQQTDFDGTFSYSKIVVIDFTGQKGHFTVAAFPNPVTTTLNVLANETVTYRLVDASGQVVRIIVNAPANSKHQIDTDGLADGTYLLRVFNDNDSVTKKILVNK